MNLDRAVHPRRGGAVLANGGVAKIDANRQIRVFSGGSAGTIDFLVDVTGYYV